MPTLSRVTLATTLFAGLLLTGCAQHPTTRPATRAPAAQPAAAGAATHGEPAIVKAGKPTETELPDRTGIAACDDYLSSYLACHRAAHIFAADQLQSRYDAMRTNLLRDSQNPNIRPQLAERCNSLARSLRQALHGKSCEVSPAPASSSP